ncbi:MAG: SCP2 sterol-binding domain-containing protein [Candidatus Thermoplasmatota archaeon]|jgi:putative sterol carrier protein|nr:SCP2 sterol-binding domain-containing protein [Candidatus Thermoplasmatota archaeon]MCL5785621.1 SCP2 sterol-binding domain-containing protein [Candidatus Thermoplasmatota archaeon]
MSKFPSDQWVSEYAEKLNESKEYEEAGKTWEGDLLFVIKPEEAGKGEECIYLDLFHGKCRGARFIPAGKDPPKTAFRYIGKMSNWRKLMNNEIDPIKGILTGKFKLEGSMMKIMRYSKAAKVMVDTVSKVPTEY